MDCARSESMDARMRGLHRMRSAAFIVAIAAIAMRALIPSGWMPATASESHGVIMPCPMANGMTHMPAPPLRPGKHGPAAPHDSVFCRFASTAQFAPASPASPLQALRTELAPVTFTFLDARAPVLPHD